MPKRIRVRRLALALAMLTLAAMHGAADTRILHAAPAAVEIGQSEISLTSLYGDRTHCLHAMDLCAKNSNRCEDALEAALGTSRMPAQVRPLSQADFRTIISATKASINNEETDADTC